MHTKSYRRTTRCSTSMAAARDTSSGPGICTAPTYQGPSAQLSISAAQLTRVLAHRLHSWTAGARTSASLQHTVLSARGSGSGSGSSRFTLRRTTPEPRAQHRSSRHRFAVRCILALPPVAHKAEAMIAWSLPSSASLLPSTPLSQRSGNPLACPTNTL